MVTFAQAMRDRLNATFTGNATERPAWIDELEHGSDIGFFGPSSAAWSVHGGMSTIAAGVRALLVQAMHPGALAGVADHSRYQEDPFGRLAGTIRWIYTVTHGDTATARAGSDFVLKLHERVTGTYVDGHGAPREYSANDPDLLRWVHLAFTDSFLRAAQQWGDPIPGGADAYVAEWATAGELMRVPNPPRTDAELRDALDEYWDAGLLAVTERTRDVVRFIRNPPLAHMLRPGYRVLFHGAAATLDPRHRSALGLRLPPGGEYAATRAAGLVLDGIGGVLGTTPGSERAARVRIARLHVRAA
ncbi:oxygenase MpaB family protein [Curtobacterium ammoniigenes]|uniref:oxygenase MpaB family protein n=1 Tax=Curtobacterium ammoniigenes TaxID=395387 RepID=UPI00083710EC|nr:oxygenase MpaB family protein [Curtobacterium ammoniigenes]